MSVRHPAAYAKSFFGVIDLVAVLPTYLSLLLPASQALLTLRGVHLLCVFPGAQSRPLPRRGAGAIRALRESVRKIVIFIGAVPVLVLVMGSRMYLIEGPESGFDTIPVSLYWAIVTMTTVGYGDLAPVTVSGRMLAALVMITGYGIIAVPTGIVTVEMGLATRRATARRCPICGLAQCDRDAVFCKR